MEIPGPSEATQSLRRQLRDVTLEYNAFAGSVAAVAEPSSRVRGVGSLSEAEFRDTFALQVDGSGDINNADVTRASTALDFALDAIPGDPDAGRPSEKPTNWGILNSALEVVQGLDRADLNIESAQSLGRGSEDRKTQLQYAQTEINDAKANLEDMRNRLGRPRS
jgi:hypothetical protein